MKLRFVEALQVGAGLTCGLVLAGCAKHADFLEIRDQVSIIARTQDQEQKRFEAMQRRLESLERVREPEGGKLRLDDALARLQKLEDVWPRLKKLNWPKPPPFGRTSRLPKPIVRRVSRSRPGPLSRRPSCPECRRLRRPRPSISPITTTSTASSILP